MCGWTLTQPTFVLLVPVCVFFWRRSKTKWLHLKTWLFFFFSLCVSLPIRRGVRPDRSMDGLFVRPCPLYSEMAFSFRPRFIHRDRYTYCRYRARDKERRIESMSKLYRAQPHSSTSPLFSSSHCFWQSSHVTRFRQHLQPIAHSAFIALFWQRT